MSQDIELLRQYAEERCEAAFAELTRRHVDLVYSAALRQVDGNTHLAEEIAQTVFADLARKARSLLGHSSLTAWLYTATRYTAMNSRRNEARRQAREKEAAALAAADSEEGWKDLCPILDEAMHTLKDQDRDAILWRFFEGQGFTQIGQRLGIAENAARMRTERALEKLREAIQKRGVIASAAGLGAMLLARSVSAAPPQLSVRILAHMGRSALARSVASHPGLNVKFAGLTAAGLFLAAILTSMPLFKRSVPPVQPSSQAIASQPASSKTAKAAPAALQGNSAGATDATAIDSLSGARVRQLELVTMRDENGEPLPNVDLEVRSFDGEKWRKDNVSTSERGAVLLSITENAVVFQILVRGDGHENKRLKWHPERGDKIPERYILRLGRGVEIGGTVVDPDGAGVAEATVSFGHSDTPEMANTLETRAYGYAETKTDANGRWRMQRFGLEMLKRSLGAAKHERHVIARVELENNSEAIQRLTNGTHVLRLGRALAILGVVRDQDGAPIAGARVSTEELGFATRRGTTTRSDGTFLLSAVKPGPGLLTAEADGYAPTTQPVEIEETDVPYEIRLDRGKTIRFRVLDPEGLGIGGATVRLDTLYTDLGQRNQPKPADIQVDFALTTDAQGRAVWTNAPDALLAYSPSARGFMHHPSVLLRPSEQEHVIALDYALRIGGTVRADSGARIDRYRIRLGWPEQVYGSDKLVPRWSDIDRFTVSFSQPQFELNLTEPVLYSPEHRGYFLKIEAEGFTPYMSRLIGPKEREVQIDVILAAADRQGVKIVDASGAPVPNAPVIYLPEGRFVNVGPDGFRQFHEPFPELRTDAQGTVPLKFDSELTRLVVACPSGCANMLRDQLSPDRLVRLTPWGRIEGRVLREAVPSEGELLILSRPENLGSRNAPPKSMPPLLFRTDPVVSDSEGRFVFTNAPPGESFLILVRHKFSPEGKFIEAVHEWKAPQRIETASPIQVTIELPASDLRKPAPMRRIPYVFEAERLVR